MSREELKNAINEVLYEVDETGQTRIAREINAHVDLKGNEIVSALTKRLLFPAAGVLLLGASFFYSFDNRLNLLEEGGSYTQAEHDVYADYVDRRFQEIQLRIDERLKNIEAGLAETKELKQTLNVILSRLPAS